MKTGLSFRSLAVVLLSLVSLVWPLQAQSQSHGGRWEGSIDVAGRSIGFVLDLARGEGDRWQGTIAIPSQGNVQLPLLNLRVAGAAISFDIPGVPGYASYKGSLAADGAAIKGDFTQGGQQLPLEFARKGESTLKAEAKSERADLPALAPLKGDWEGVLDISGQTLRLKFMIAPGEQAGMDGVLDSIDQRVWVPVEVVSLDKGVVRFEVKLIQGGFEGKLGQDGAQIEGTWNQPAANLSAPLTLKRAAAR